MTRKISALALCLVFFLSVSQSPTTVTIQPDDSESSNHPILLMLDEILQIDPDCLSPCWWGFNLGEARQAEIRQFFDDLLPETEFDADQRVQIRQSSIFVNGSGRSINIGFYGDRPMAEGISIMFQGNNIPPVNNQLLYGYDLLEVMNAYNMPDKIFVNTQNDPPAGHDIALIYDEEPLVLSYSFRPSNDHFYDTDNDNYLSCFNIEDMWIFHLYAGRFDFEATMEVYETSQEFWTPLEEASEFTVQSFYEAVINGEQPCIALPAPPPGVP